MLCQISRVRCLFTKPVLSTILNSVIFSKILLSHCMGRHIKAKSTDITISAKLRHLHINRY